MKEVEQIDTNGAVVLALDETLGTDPLRNVLGKFLKITNKGNPFSVLYKGKNTTIGVKNISYLGHPHPIHKKRIQIPKSWKPFLQTENSILLGIYSFRGEHLFCIFDTAKYRKNDLNNSSAHLHTIDLIHAKKNGVFQKTDARGNRITVFRPDHFEEVFDAILFGKTISQSPEIAIFEEFKSTLPRVWKGISCYEKMIAANFSDKFQPEWPGFFCEFQFQNFLNSNPSKKEICRFQKQKTKEGIDLDLNFHNEFFGDLKMHDERSGAILGNDRETILKTLERFPKIWYVIFEHETKKDSNFQFAVCDFWNRAQKKSNLRSYSNRMKHEITIKTLIIAEITPFNSQYLSIFSQGKNSNGKSRASKIKINKKDLDNFVIFRKNL